MVRLRDFARVLVVLLDRFEFVPQIRLKNRLHVAGQIGQPLLDVCGLGPDSACHHQLVIIGQMHESGEILAKSDRVEDRETYLARRERCEQTQHRNLQQVNGRGATLCA